MIHHQVKHGLTELWLSAVVASIAMAFFTADARAEDGNKMFSINGFGTVAAAQSSLDKGDFVSSIRQASGPGLSKDTDFGVDSKLGLQVNGNFTEQFSAVLQMVSQRNTDGTFTPKVEWANIKYALTPDWSVRLGRTVLPTYMLGESRLVGYSNPWIRPPVETYNLLPITNADGLDMSYRQRFGSVSNTISGLVGKTQVDVVSQLGAITKDVKGTNIYSLADTVEYGAFTARLGLLRADFEMLPVPNFLVKFKVKMVNLGVAYDPGTWFVQGEYSKADFGTVSTASKAFYVTGGYRVNSLTPYITYSEVRPDGETRANRTRDQDTISLGLRWDAIKNAAVKVQWDRVKLATGSDGFFTNAKAGLAGSRGDVVSVGVDFVF